MELKHSFTVPVSLDRAWDVLLDVERVATCMPGASLDSVDGDDIAGKIKVKVGPITQVYAGKAHFTERNREAHVVTLEASGKETRGSGTASATVRSELVPDGDQTQVTVLTNLNVTGKAAQFGRGRAVRGQRQAGRHLRRQHGQDAGRRAGRGARPSRRRRPRPRRPTRSRPRPSRPARIRRAGLLRAGRFLGGPGRRPG